MMAGSGVSALPTRAKAGLGGPRCKELEDFGVTALRQLELIKSGTQMLDGVRKKASFPRVKRD